MTWTNEYFDFLKIENKTVYYSILFKLNIKSYFDIYTIKKNLKGETITFQYRCGSVGKYQEIKYVYSTTE